MRWLLTTSAIVTHRLRTRAVMTLIAGVGVVLPTNAHAFGEYRDKVAAYASVNPEKVPCDTCHNDPGGGGPKERPFFFTLLDNGLSPSSIDTLTPALESADAKNADSDGDSVEDIAELKAGFSPNDPASKPPPDNTGGSGPAGSGGGGPAGSGGGGGGPAGSGGSGRAGSGGTGGSSTTPRSTNSDEDDGGVELAPGATTKTCSASNARGGSAQGTALVVALTLLSRLRLRRRGRSS